MKNRRPVADGLRIVERAHRIYDGRGVQSLHCYRAIATGNVAAYAGRNAKKLAWWAAELQAIELALSWQVPS